MCASRRRAGRGPAYGPRLRELRRRAADDRDAVRDGVLSPPERSTRRARRTPGGTRTRCSNAAPSSTTPRTWPASTGSPDRDLGPERPRSRRRRTSSHPGAGTSRRARSAGAARRRHRRAGRARAAPRADGAGCAPVRRPRARRCTRAPRRSRALRAPRRSRPRVRGRRPRRGRACATPSSASISTSEPFTRRTRRGPSLIATAPRPPRRGRRARGRRARAACSRSVAGLLGDDPAERSGIADDLTRPARVGARARRGQAVEQLRVVGRRPQTQHRVANPRRATRARAARLASSTIVGRRRAAARGVLAREHRGRRRHRPLSRARRAPALPPLARARSMRASASRARARVERRRRVPLDGAPERGVEGVELGESVGAVIPASPPARSRGRSSRRARALGGGRGQDEHADVVGQGVPRRRRPRRRRPRRTRPRPRARSPRPRASRRARRYGSCLADQDDRDDQAVDRDALGETDDHERAPEQLGPFARPRRARPSPCRRRRARRRATTPRPRSPHR